MVDRETLDFLYSDCTESFERLKRHMPDVLDVVGPIPTMTLKLGESGVFNAIARHPGKDFGRIIVQVNKGLLAGIYTAIVDNF